LTASQLSSLLFAGFGEVGEKFDQAGNRYPLTTAPSGGACSPLSAAVVIRRVRGLAAGMARYSAADEKLRYVGNLHNDEEVILASAQVWAASSAVLIAVVADVRRTMRRYRGLGTYQVILFEAGHRAQNILLSAKSMGLGSCITAAVDRSSASGRLGLDWPWESVIYTIAVGWSAANGVHTP
jgi:SagB-type dehydrogenase family enzyme